MSSFWGQRLHILTNMTYIAFIRLPLSISCCGAPMQLASVLKWHTLWIILLGNRRTRRFFIKLKINVLALICLRKTSTAGVHQMRLLHRHSLYHFLWCHLMTFYPQKRPYLSFENNAGQTDLRTYGRTYGPTDGRTDGRTDTTSYRDA